MIVIHHIIVDHPSLTLLARELAEICRALVERRTPCLHAPPLEYTEYTLWQRGITREQLEPLLLYWRWQLRGDPAPLCLPEDRPRPAIHTYTAARETFVINRDLAQRLRALALKEDTTALSVALAGFKVLLHYYCRRQDVVVGMSDPSRDQPATEGAIGPLANLLVLRSRLADDVSFQAFLAQVSQTVRQAKAHRELSFDMVVRELKPENDMSRTAMFIVLFRFEDSEPPVLDFGGVQADVVDTNLGHGKYDLNLLVDAGTDGWVGTAIYNADIYDQSTIRQMMNHYETILLAITEDPCRRISEIDLLSATKSASSSTSGTRPRPVIPGRRRSTNCLKSRRLGRRTTSPWCARATG